jgi:hypothetical protein
VVRLDGGRADESDVDRVCRRMGLSPAAASRDHTRGQDPRPHKYNLKDISVASVTETGFSNGSDR